MRNQDYDAPALAEAIAMTAEDTRGVEHILVELEERLILTGDAYDAHAHDHAAETLMNASKQLKELSERVSRLTAYTNYPPAK